MVSSVKNVMANEYSSGLSTCRVTSSDIISYRVKLMQQSISGKGPAVDSSMLLASKRKAILRGSERSYATNPKKMLITTTEQLQDRKQSEQACSDISTLKKGPTVDCQ